MYHERSIGLSLILIMLLILCPVGTAEELMNEENQNLAYELPSGFVYVRDVIPDVIEEMRYAGEHNFTGTVVDGYEANAAILTIQAAEALKKAADEFRTMGYRIKVFDAYRPQRAVRCFVRWSEEPSRTETRSEFYPEFKNKTLLVDQGYIARNSAHCRGSAIDITLVDQNGEELDMGTCFDYFGKLAWYGASGLTEQQQENRELLRSVMIQYGFKPFDHEWWHFRLRNEPYDSGFDFVVK